MSDEQVRTFWESEFGQYTKQFRNEAVAPILKKTGVFRASPVIRRALGARDGGLDLRQAMGEGKIVVATLAKGRLGEDASSLLGAVLVSGFEAAALSRQDLPEHRTSRKDQRVCYASYVRSISRRPLSNYSIGGKKNRSLSEISA